MNGANQAPPIYRPDTGRVTAPPVYRPTAAARPALQPKSTASLKLETRPAPAVYRPSRSPASITLRKSLAEARPGPFPLGIPPAPPGGTFSRSLHPSSPHWPAVIQRMEEPSSSGKTSTQNVAEGSHKVLKDYRPGLLGEIEGAFLKAGYNIHTVRQAILRGLRAWGKDISGHSSKPGSTDQGEQGDLDGLCIEARDFLVGWAAQNPATQKTKTSGLQHSGTKKAEVAEKKQKAKGDKKTGKHREWHADLGTPTGGTCSVCKQLGI